MNYPTVVRYDPVVRRSRWFGWQWSYEEDDDEFDDQEAW